MKLTEKQKRFVDYYIETGNATEAAKKAGYKGNNLNRIASENLSKLDIQQYINDLVQSKDEKRIAKQDEVLEYLTLVLRGQETEKIPVMGRDYFEMVDNTPSIKDRTKAAELLGKRYAMWTDKQQLEANIGVTIVDDLDED